MFFSVPKTSQKCCRVELCSDVILERCNVAGGQQGALRRRKLDPEDQQRLFILIGSIKSSNSDLPALLHLTKLCLHPSRVA